MVPGIVLALGAVIGIAVAAFGGPIVILWAAAVAALFLTLRRWMPAPSALGTATALFLAAELGMLYLNPLFGAPLPVLDLVAWSVVSLGAAVWLVLRPAAAIGSRGWWMALAAASGSLIVTVSMLAAQVVPGATRLAWAMNSDAVNVMTFSRDILAAGGLVGASSDQDTSPTPLPFGMLATALAPGRASVAEGALAEHDVVRLAQLWVFMIALACLLAGAITVRATASVRLSLAIPATVVASLVGLSWYVIGVQFDYGFFSSAFAVVLLLASWLVYLDGDTRPATSLAVLLLAGTVVLAVWSPLVICVAAFGVVIVVTRWRALVTSGPLRLAALGVCLLIFIGYIALVTLPEYLAKSSFLGANGGFPVFGPGQVVTIMVVTALVAALGARFLGLRYPVIGTLAVVTGAAIGLAFLLSQRTGAESGWGYYPAKYAWTFTILLIVITIGASAAFLAHVNLRRGWDVAIAVLGVGVLAGLVWSPVQPSAQAPLVSVLAGTSGGMPDRASTFIFDYSGRADGQNVFWRSSVGDSWPNLWLLQLDVDDNHHNPVRSFAYQTATFTPEQMCEVVELLGSDVVIRTADPAAQTDLDAVCDAEYTVELGDY